MNSSGKFSAGADDSILQVYLPHTPSRAASMQRCSDGGILLAFHYVAACYRISEGFRMTPVQLADGSVRMLDAFSHFDDMPASSAECSKQL